MWILTSRPFDLAAWLGAPACVSAVALLSELGRAAVCPHVAATLSAPLWLHQQQQFSRPTFARFGRHARQVEGWTGYKRRLNRCHKQLPGRCHGMHATVARVANGAPPGSQAQLPHTFPTWLYALRLLHRPIICFNDSGNGTQACTGVGHSPQLEVPSSFIPLSSQAWCAVLSTACRRGS